MFSQYIVNKFFSLLFIFLSTTKIMWWIFYIFVDLNDTETLVDIDFNRFKAQSKNIVVKKTLSIPKYLNELGTNAGINFSQTLTEALKEKLGV